MYKQVTAKDVQLRKEVQENIGYANYDNELFEISISVSTLNRSYERNIVLVEQLLHDQPFNYVDVLSIVAELHSAVFDQWKLYDHKAKEMNREETRHSDRVIRDRDLLREIRDSIEDLWSYTDSLGLEIDEEGNIENRLERKL